MTGKGPHQAGPSSDELSIQAQVSELLRQVARPQITDSMARQKAELEATLNLRVVIEATRLPPGMVQDLVFGGGPWEGKLKDALDRFDGAMHTAFCTGTSPNQDLINAVGDVAKAAAAVKSLGTAGVAVGIAGPLAVYGLKLGLDRFCKQPAKPGGTPASAPKPPARS